MQRSLKKRQVMLYVITWKLCILSQLINSLHRVFVQRFSHVQLFVTLWTAAHQVLLSVGFSQQEYRSV